MRLPWPNSSENTVKNKNANVQECLKFVATTHALAIRTVKYSRLPSFPLFSRLFNSCFHSIRTSQAHRQKSASLLSYNCGFVSTLSSRGRNSHSVSNFCTFLTLRLKCRFCSAECCFWWIKWFSCESSMYIKSAIGLHKSAHE